MQECHKNFFQKLGIKNTIQRDLVIHDLQENKKASTAEEIYLRIKKKNKDLSLSTVYRVLETFYKNNIVNKFATTNKNSTLYEYVRKEHSHTLTCTVCQKIIHIETCPIIEYEKSIAKKMDFKITGHKLNFFGICSECKKKIYNKESDTTVST